MHAIVTPIKKFNKIDDHYNVVRSQSKFQFSNSFSHLVRSVNV
jgi:hypothetical protein